MSATIPTGLLVLHGNRAELLAETVAGWLARQPLSPLEDEIVLVQSNGMAEWLKMTLAGEMGVCAASRVELPARFQWWLYRQVLGREGVPRDSPLDKVALTWRLVRLLPDLALQPGFAPVAGFLHDDDPERLLQLAQRLADLLDQYQVYRADWLGDWAEGRDVLRDGHGQTVPVPADQAWQPLLWRALLASVGPGALGALRPQLHRQVLARLHEADHFAGPLPRRVVLFGMTHVPLPTLELLAALSRHSQVVLAVPNPCRFHWADIIDGRELLRQQRRRQPLKAGRDLAETPLEALHLHAHPLLAAWGRQGRDFVRQLDAFDDAQQARQRFALPRLDLFDEEGADDGAVGLALLRQVQAHIRDLTPLAEHPHAEIAADDRSIVFQVAHSAMREVEVLHDHLLRELARPTPAGERALAPRDIVVMVPDIEAFAPAIHAVFGQYGRHDARHIPYDIADLSAKRSSPIVTAVEWLLRLPQQRCTASELRDLIEVPALAARFGLDAEALLRLTQWMEDAGLRWGLSAAQRERLGLAECGPVNSAWWALRRMLMGYAAGGAPRAPGVDEPFAGIEPHAEVAGLEAELAGGLAELLDRLNHWWPQLDTPATPVEWAERGRALLADLFLGRSEDERQVLQALDEALSRWLRDCDLAGFDRPVPLAVAREAWLAALDEPALNRRFRAGGVTFCTLMPMRAIPFELVCLLGMNEGDYPRRAPRSDFDLMAQPGQGRPGDRARRDDDRQLMLEALLSARRQLYVSWTGRSVRDNSAQPPSVLVAQLRDYLAAGWSPAVVTERTREHPLQPFSRRYFEPGSAFQTYAREWRQAHADAVTEAPSPAPVVQEAEAAPTVLTLELLARFLRNPVKAFFRHRLGVVFDEADALTEDEERFALDGLEAHGLLGRLLEQAVGAAGDAQAPVNAATLVQQIQREGALPLGGPGQKVAQTLAEMLGQQLAAWAREQAQWPEPAPHRPVEARAGQVVLQDWLQGLRQAPGGLPVALLITPSRLVQGSPGKETPRAEPLLAAWLWTLAAAAMDTPVGVVLVGRDATLRCQPPDGEEARAVLPALLESWQAGMEAPLPVALRTALAWVRQERPEQAYEGSFTHTGEVVDPCLARLFEDFEALTADGQFEAWAMRLYAPLAAWVAQGVQIEMHGSSLETLAEEDR
jgi:exodeoxyribonuclease V gamma subunit